MKKLSLALLALLAACGPVVKDPPARQWAAAEVERCERSGGKVQRVCGDGRVMCVRKFKDAGRVCGDSLQCMGGCYANIGDGESVPMAGMRARGACRKDDAPCVCGAEVVSGRVQSFSCVN